MQIFLLCSFCFVCYSYLLRSTYLLISVKNYYSIIPNMIPFIKQPIRNLLREYQLRYDILNQYYLHLFVIHLLTHLKNIVQGVYITISSLTGDITPCLKATNCKKYRFVHITGYDFFCRRVCLERV